MSQTSSSTDNLLVTVANSKSPIEDLRQNIVNLYISKDNFHTLSDQIYDKVSLHTYKQNIDIQFNVNFDKNKLLDILRIYHENSSKRETNILTSKVHAFRTFAEIANLKENEIYVNNNVKLIGLYKFRKYTLHDEVKCHLLEGKHPCETILLDLKYQNMFPTTGSNIIVFGYLNTKQIKSLQCSVVNVKFWKYVSQPEDYKKICNLQKTFRPKEIDTKFKYSNSAEETVLDISTTDNLFDTIDASLFIKTVEENENLYFEIEKLMSIQSDLFL